MSNIKFMAFEDESKVANAGGLVSTTFKGKTATLELVSPWSKDGKDRTKSGSLGVTTSAGWMNASELISFLGKLPEDNAARQALILATEVSPASGRGATAKAAVYEYELVVGDGTAINVSFDNDGKISKVELA